jgi:iron complex transport system substrate-binding protein
MKLHAFAARPTAGAVAVFAALLAVPLLPAQAGPTTRPATKVAVATPGCVRRYKKTTDYFPDKASLSAAKNLTIRYTRNYKVVTIAKAFPGAAKPVVYVLVQCGTPAPKLTDDLAGATVIKVPIASAALMSTTVAPSFDALGLADRVVGVDDPNNYSTASVVARIKSGAVKTVGNNAKANLEVLATLKPTVVIASSSGDDTADGFAKMREIGLSVVIEGSWLEETALGRSEWMKFISALTNTEKSAEAQFAGWQKHYADLAAKAAATTTRPKAISGSMYEGTWYMPGGKSYVAQLLRDAGASYPWDSDTTTGAIPLDFEAVLAKGQDAAIWINAGYLWADLDAATKEDPRYSKLAAFASGQVWGNDLRVNATGGNDFYETAVLRPDQVLEDLISIVHPEVAKDYRPIFYRRVPKK